MVKKLENVNPNSKYIGVFKAPKSSRWKAIICINNELYDLGTYDTFDQAHAMYTIVQLEGLKNRS